METPPKKASILVVEDNDLLGDIIVAKLVGSGYQVAIARDGADALTRITKDHFDLVLLDIILPLMDGYEVLENVRKNPATAGVAVIIISNSGQPVELERLRALGVKDYLIKADFTPEEVLAKIRAQLGESPTMSWPEHFTMLIVEDDPFLKDLLSRKMTGLSNVWYATDGEEAIKTISEKRPSIVLLDILLPGIDGFEVLKRTRADEANKNTIIIVLSNFNQEFDIKRAQELGADDYLVKSNFTIDEVITKMREHVAKKYPGFVA